MVNTVAKMNFMKLNEKFYDVKGFSFNDILQWSATLGPCATAGTGRVN